MKKALIIIGVIIGVLIISGLIAGWMLHDPRPTGKTGPAADELAHKMMASVNKTAWDTTTFVKWTFPGGHHFLWDKKRGMIEVKWDENRVIIRDNGRLVKAWQMENEVEGDTAKKLTEKAWSFFCNDSFWLNAVVKAFDPGTERAIVTQEDGTEALLVTYNSGGVTPGDAYLWELGDDNKPYAWRMWVNIIPIGGLAVSWEDWIELSTGALISTRHDWGTFESNMENVAGGNTLSSVGLSEDPFANLK